MDYRTKTSKVEVKEEVKAELKVTEGFGDNANVKQALRLVGKTQITLRLLEH